MKNRNILRGMLCLNREQGYVISERNRDLLATVHRRLPVGFRPLISYAVAACSWARQARPYGVRDQLERSGPEK
jgi:hypothetical protein